jgi:trimeric autotransporter adhesin
MRSPTRVLTSAVTLCAVLTGGGIALAGPALAATQSITTIAGNGTRGSTGDGGVAVKAELNLPSGVAEDLTGSLYIADPGNNKVRKVVDPTVINSDIISTFAGTGGAGFAGDKGLASAAKLNSPTGVAVDSSGDVFIADTGNNRIREVNPSGVINTVAGNGTCSKTLGNGGAGTSASLCAPSGVAVSGGKLYIADPLHFEVRVVNLSTGVITDFAGNGTAGYSGDGGSATSATLGLPVGVAVDSTGHVYIADAGDTVVREVSSGTITTFAGNGKFGYAGDGSAANKAELSAPTGVGTDQLGNVYISDTGNDRIRVVNSAGIINTLAGNGKFGFSGDGGAATSAELGVPAGSIAADGTAVYFSDTGNERVRGVFNGSPPVLPETYWVYLLPIGAVAIFAAFVIIRRRRSVAAVG